MIYGSAWDALDVPLTDTNSITITIHPLPAPSFSSNVVGNTFCEGEEVLFTASGGVSYVFFLNGVEVQAQSNVSTLTLDGIPDNAEVRVRIFNAENCSVDFPLTMIKNSLNSGDVRGNQILCNGGIPVSFTSLSAGSIEGVAAVNGQYQWQSSTDGVNWNEIVGATSQLFLWDFILSKTKLQPWAGCKICKVSKYWSRIQQSKI